MSTFYHILAGYYDTLFPAEPEIVEFLVGSFNAERPLPAQILPVIDAACGTGNYTAALTERGIPCIGFDADGNMITRAQTEEKRGRFVTGRLENLLETLAAEGVSPEGVSPATGTGTGARGLFCIGNSLPHLESHQMVRDFFLDARQVLAPAGTLIVQTVNFARFAPDTSGDEIRLPSVQRDEITMHRLYRRSELAGRVIFHMELEPRGSQAVGADTSLLALKDEDLREAAAEAGFTNLQTYGSFSGEPFREDESFLMVLVATSPGD